MPARELQAGIADGPEEYETLPTSYSTTMLAVWMTRAQLAASLACKPSAFLGRDLRLLAGDQMESLTHRRISSELIEFLAPGAARIGRQPTRPIEAEPGPSVEASARWFRRASAPLA